MYSLFFILLCIYSSTILSYNTVLSTRSLLENDICSDSYNLTLNGTDSKYLFKPTSTSRYYPNMSCSWKVDINYANNFYMLYIDATLALDDHDSLIISVCNTSTILYNNQISNEQQYFQLYTQEEEICLEFNSTDQDKDKSIFFWYIYFTLITTPNITQINLSKDEPIHVLENLSNYNIWNISALSGSLQIYFYGIEPDIPPSGFIYLYNSSSLTNFNTILQYPTKRVEIFNFTDHVTLFYAGISNNTIKLVSRIPEYHTANCDIADNLLFFEYLNPFKNINITATNGSCLLSLIVPLCNIEGYIYQFVIYQLDYYGDQSFSVVAGYNSTFTLWDSNHAKNLLNSTQYLYFYGNLISFIIPSNSTLIGSFFTSLTKPYDYDHIFAFHTDTFFNIVMSPNYPNYELANDNTSNTVYYSVDYATIRLVIFAYIPENCYLIISDGNKTLLEITNQTKLNYTISFNVTIVKIEFVGTNDSSVEWRGFLVQVFGERISPPNNTHVNIVHSKSKAGLIIGLSTSAAVIVVAIIVFVTYYQLKKRYRKFDMLCNILKEMDKTSEEIVSLKEQVKQLLIPQRNLQIEFDCVIGQGSTSTVYKGYLEGQAPLHLMQKSLHTQRFMDCDVAIKLNKNFGQNEVEQLFKEIDAMKKIGYHENIMCMLGWTFSNKLFCLVFDIADKSLLDFLKCLRGCAEDQIPRMKFLSFLWQIARGMEYIASKKIIHRDLAARNVLLFGNFVAKISDFGLCCFMDENLTYFASTIENLPIKWLALESLTEKIFSEKSDVWAFGVLMYEIFTFGQIPYATKNDEELLEFLQTGNRLEQPDGVNDTLYEIMVGCWNKEAESRPSFSDLEKRFHEFIDIRNEVYGYVQPTFDNESLKSKQ